LEYKAHLELLILKKNITKRKNCPIQDSSSFYWQLNERILLKSIP